MARTCKWCGREIKSWFLRYDDESFCRDNDDLCLKNYLFEKFDKDIEEDREEGETKYTMDYITFLEERGLD